jgi:hypothetical protein
VNSNLDTSVTGNSMNESDLSNASETVDSLNSLKNPDLLLSDINKPQMVRKYISFVSRALKSHEAQYSVTKLEGLAISFGLAKFRHYLIGHHFKLYTDHKALINLFHMKNDLFSHTMITWLEQILEYDFELIHIPGIHNFLPDKLSRIYEDEVKLRTCSCKETQSNQESNLQRSS